MPVALLVQLRSAGFSRIVVGIGNDDQVRRPLRLSYGSQLTGIGFANPLLA